MPGTAPLLWQATISLCPSWCSAWCPVLCRSDHGGDLVLPLVLVSLAGLVEHTLGSHFPAWGRSEAGVHLLQELASAPAQLLDPQCCYRSLAVLASSRAAVAARKRQDVGPSPLAGKRTMYHALSSVVAAAIGVQPGSTGARQMLLAAVGRQHMQEQADRMQRQQPQQQQAAIAAAAAAPVHTAAARKMRQAAVTR
ncbi:hypothetical protein COO60DRAFT_195389 [Scenedesmus sp. NREL 46B-D3]|nr:hypothetical protein COO60DRAFT_195389 [Scenedesmus sp. NREL 46B-D3]